MRLEKEADQKENKFQKLQESLLDIFNILEQHSVSNPIEEDSDESGKDDEQTMDH